MFVEFTVEWRGEVSQALPGRQRSDQKRCPCRAGRKA